MKNDDRYECPDALQVEMEAERQLCVGSNGEDTQPVGEIDYNEGWII